MTREGRSRDVEIYPWTRPAQVGTSKSQAPHGLWSSVDCLNKVLDSLKLHIYRLNLRSSLVVIRTLESLSLLILCHAAERC